jgi:peptidoglycan hydrolase CwlO-like protein
MSPPLAPQDLDAISRLLYEHDKKLLAQVDKKIEERIKPVEHKQGTMYREIAPTVKGLRDSHHDLEDRSMGFEKLMLDSLAATRQEVAAVAKSIPPAAKAASGAEDAAVAGAKAAIQGATAAIDSKTNAIAAKVRANQTLIVLIFGIIVQAGYQAYQHITAPPPQQQPAAPGAR